MVFEKSFDTKEKKKGYNLMQIFKAYLILFFFATTSEVIILRFIPPVFTPLMILRAAESISKPHSPFFPSHEWKSMENISPEIQIAVISSEDQNFKNHYGLDLKEIRKAFKSSTKDGKKKLRGASTISQQVAKNVFLIPGRSYVRKAFELYYTFLIETFWSKKRILEIYLNSIEMGDGIYGAEAASLKYFNKSAAKLTRNEAVAIAAILPNPREYSVSKPSKYIQGRRRWIKNQMNSLGMKYLNDL